MSDAIGRKKRFGQPRESDDQRAIAALKTYNAAAENPQVYNKLTNYAGGTVYLIEFKESGNTQFWSVLMRGSDIQVFYDWEMLLREAVIWKKKIMV